VSSIPDANTVFEGQEIRHRERKMRGQTEKEERQKREHSRQEKIHRYKDTEERSPNR
jgi:hypothetical protein